MQLTADSRIVAAEEQLQPLAEVLSGEIDLLTGLKLKVTTGRAGQAILCCGSTRNSGRASQSWWCAIASRSERPAPTHIAIDRQAVVTGFDYRATAEGSSTILQLLGRLRWRVSAAQADDQGLAARRLLRRPAGRGAARPSHRGDQEGGATMPALQGPLSATAPDRRSGLDFPIDQVSATGLEKLRRTRRHCTPGLQAGRS